MKKTIQVICFYAHDFNFLNFIGEQIQQGLIDNIQTILNQHSDSRSEPITHSVVIMSLFQLWTTKSPSTHFYLTILQQSIILFLIQLGTNMLASELHYYTINAHTSYNEAFHSFLLKWLGKDVYYKLTHDAR